MTKNLAKVRAFEFWTLNEHKSCRMFAKMRDEEMVMIDAMTASPRLKPGPADLSSRARITPVRKSGMHACVVSTPVKEDKAIFIAILHTPSRRTLAQHVFCN